MSRSKRFLPISSRLAQRRKRKKERAQAKEAPPEENHLSADRRAPSDDPIFDWQPSNIPVTPEKPRSAWTRFLSLFRREPTLPPSSTGAPPPSEDPLREILSHPKGPARFDAFEIHLSRLQPGSPGHRTVSLAFHQELCALAKNMNVDLRLLESRVEKCAKGLAQAGEKERAGELLAMLGLNEQATELFVEAGAVEKLQEAHFDQELERGPQQFDAQMAFQKATTEFSLHQRKQAFTLLRKARELAPQNQQFQKVEDDWNRRRVDASTLVLQTPNKRLVISTQWPVIIGRGEDSIIPFRRPRMSRKHLRIDWLKGQLTLHPLVQPTLLMRGETEAEATEEETFVAHLLQDAWFASLVGWTAGLHDSAHVVQQLRKSTRIILRGAETS